MPQLILDPWFLILILSWMVFLIIIPPKILSHYFNNEPEMTTSHSLKTYAWTWMWH
uniref:ATP synthase complex subunit 8 n=1 Tax=Moenkhausia costae TaxID=1053577 RepID=A0A8F0WGY2_9TELE|nr:ATP synthase F0 subunit 8 [Moenkhausia costae]QWM93841.1 ATP synthase subunit 8 [Moenkhausia costae]QZK22888.1 ATP synthase F0 subunit 8 [Moenkhausia costae]